jgi:hypothetical protein
MWNACGLTNFLKNEVNERARGGDESEKKTNIGM